MLSASKMTADTTAVFFDIGGVLLTNAWDHSARERTAEHFGLDWQSFETLHKQVVADLETGRLGLEEYLERTVFYQARSFTPDTFKRVMLGQSKPYPEALAFLAELARSRQYLLATLNNESKELNEQRIERYGLREYFTAFFSSCFLGVRKPDRKIYRLALDICQRRAEECLFVDDRAENVESARDLGVRAIRYEGVAHLREALK